jgi:hypothetical protein
VNRSVPTLELRGSDPTLLHVQLPDLLRRPIGQIAPVNLMDLVELASTPGRPKEIDAALQRFVDGIARQVADIPHGRSWDQFLQDLEELAPAAVPHRFRAMLAAETVERPDTTARVQRLLEKWATAEPTPFELGTRKARVQRAEMVQPRAPSPEPSSAPREGRARAPRSERAPSAPKPKPITDIDRHQFVVAQALERLGRNPEKGLLETVLVAGVRHAAKERYPDLTPHEVIAILRQLKDANRLRYSAGRWTARY